MSSKNYKPKEKPEATRILNFPLVYVGSWKKRKKMKLNNKQTNKQKITAKRKVNAEQGKGFERLTTAVWKGF